MAGLPTKRSDIRRANTQDESRVDAGRARSQWGEDSAQPIWTKVATRAPKLSTWRKVRALAGPELWAKDRCSGLEQEWEGPAGHTPLLSELLPSSE